MHVCVCVINLRIYACVHVCYKSAWLCMCACVLLCICVRLYLLAIRLQGAFAYVYVCVFTYLCMSVFAYLCICVCVDGGEWYVGCGNMEVVRNCMWCHAVKCVRDMAHSTVGI